MMIEKVLIIEDDTTLRASIVQTLELEGLEPIATSGLLQARRTLRANFRGVVLSDIKMPDHDGFDVLSFVHSRDPDLPVILLTGYSDVPTAMRAMKAGAYDYLEKPCDPVRLTDTLRRALDHRKLVLENRAYSQKVGERVEEENEATLAESLLKHERRIVHRVLEEERGSVAAAAKRLGLPRNTLYDRMAKLQIVPKTFRREKPTERS
ncbi:MAG: response regulator [Pseudomonadota bacterium]